MVADGQTWVLPADLRTSGSRIDPGPDSGSAGDPSGPADASARAPVFLADGTLAVMTSCCLGGQQRVRRVTDGAVGSELFAVATPVLSIRRDRNGSALWLTTQDGGLLRWDGNRLQAGPRGALVTSG